MAQHTAPTGMMALAIHIGQATTSMVVSWVWRLDIASRQPDTARRQRKTTTIATRKPRNARRSQKVAVIEEEAFDGAVEDHDLHMSVSLNGRHDVPELHNEFGVHQIERRLVKRDPPVGVRAALEAQLLARCAIVHLALQ